MEKIVEPPYKLADEIAVGDNFQLEGENFRVTKVIKSQKPGYNTPFYEYTAVRKSDKKEQVFSNYPNLTLNIPVKKKFTVDTIQTGDVFYTTRSTHITKWEYLMKHPKNPNYHLMINCSSSGVESMYHRTLEDYFEQGANTYEDALRRVVSSLESSLDTFKMFLREEEEKNSK